ncbi:MAG: hypothetical protein GX153_02095, partial [Clostridiaceae bacterium]|nr:hypothetical protein [Clostridiaceae bacterium]
MTRVRLWLRIVFRQAVQARSSWITLALCLGVAVLFTQLYGGFREAERARVLHLFGAQQGLFIDAGNDVLDALRRDARVDRLGEAVVTGLASNPASGQSVTVPLGFIDDTARSLAGVALQEGRWPETESEIAIERITLSTLRLRAGVGDTVVLSVSTSPREDVPGSQPATVQISYHLVGILDNYSFMQYHPNDPDGTLTGLPSLITARNLDSEKGDAVARFVYVHVVDHASYVAFFNEYADRFGLVLDQYSLNTEAYRPDAPLKSVDGYPRDNLNSWFPHNTETETYQNASKTPRQM